MAEASANTTDLAPVKAEEAPQPAADEKAEVEKQKTVVTEAAPPRPVKIEESPDETAGGRSFAFYAVVGVAVAAVAGAAAYFIVNRNK